MTLDSTLIVLGDRICPRPDRPQTARLTAWAVLVQSPLMSVAACLPVTERLLATGATQDQAKRGQTRAKIAELLDLQDRIYAAALDPETTPAALAQLARAWVNADEQVMVRRGQPVPKPADVQRRPSRRQAQVAPVE